MLLLIFIFLNFGVTLLSACKFNCSNHGSCIWIVDPTQHGRPMNTSSLQCLCENGYFGDYCNNTSTNIQEEEKEKEKEKEIEKEIEQYLSNEIILIGSSILGFVFLLLFSYCIYRKYKARKLKETRDLLNSNTENFHKL